MRATIKTNEGILPYYATRVKRVMLTRLVEILIHNIFRFAAANRVGYISVNSRLVANSSTTAIEPFGINKKGFGIMAGWISVEDVEKIKAPRNYNL